MLEPIKAVTSPIADCNNHLGHIDRHFIEVVATICLGHYHFVIALGQVGRVPSVRSILLVEVLSYVEWLIGVDLRLIWAIISPWVVKEDISSAHAIAVTVRVATVVVALVSSRSPGILVGFHNVELWAHMAADRGCITILERIV